MLTPALALHVLTLTLSTPAEPARPKVDLRVGGLVQSDFLYFPDDEDDAYRDEFRIRRLRPLIRGGVGAFSFRLTPDIANGNLRVMDAYVDARLHRSDESELILRFGKDKPPVSMDLLSSSTTLSLLERGLTAQLSPTRDLGVALLGHHGVLEGHLMLANGAPDGSTTDPNSGDDLEVSARIGLHFDRALVGVSGSVGEARGATVATYRTPGRRTLRALPTGDDVAVGDGLRWRAGAHGYLGLGPVLVWTEALISRHEVTRAGTELDLGSAAAWNLGLSWLSHSRDNVWDAMRPADTLELAARFGLLDEGAFEDTPSLGDGELTIDAPKRLFTGAFAATWHIDSHFKAVVGYEVTKVDGFNLEHMLGLRLQANILEPL
jgi:hypothetical protein